MVPSRLGELRLWSLSLNSTEPSILFPCSGILLVGIPSSRLQVSASSEGDSEPDITASSTTEESRLAVLALVLVVFAARFRLPAINCTVIAINTAGELCQYISWLSRNPV